MGFWMTVTEKPHIDTTLIPILERVSDPEIPVLSVLDLGVIREAVEDLKNAFDKGLLPDSLENEMYFNIKRMQSLNLA